MNGAKADFDRNTSHQAEPARVPVIESPQSRDDTLSSVPKGSISTMPFPQKALLAATTILLTLGATPDK